MSLKTSYSGPTLRTCAKDLYFLKIHRSQSVVSYYYYVMDHVKWSIENNNFKNTSMNEIKRIFE